jgi:protein-L-isoaspartate(D-aspartate) O-methyltransferase
MAWTASGDSNESLINNMRKLNLIQHDDVANAMKAVDRKNYCKADEKAKYAYQDSPQEIGYNATISAPHMHGMCLELLRDYILRPGARVLDVGSGSGYLSACMAVMLQQNNIAGKVFGIEHMEPLVEQSIININKGNADLFSSGILNVRAGDGYAGLPDDAPFDCIHVGAAAPEVPKALLEQMRPGARMIIPVGPQGAQQFLMQIDRLPDGQWMQSKISGVQYVPLTTVEKQWGKIHKH